MQSESSVHTLQGWLKWGKGPGCTTYTWPGLDKLLINKLCYSNTSIKACVLFVLSSFSPSHLFGNSDLLFPDKEPVVKTSEGTLSVYLPAHQGSERLLDSKDKPCWWLAENNRRLMGICQWPDDSSFPGQQQLSVCLEPSVDELLMLLRTTRARWAGGSSGGTQPLVEG